jgi:hypothetical protein
MNPETIKTQELINFFDRASECNLDECELAPIHAEAASIAEDLRLYQDECNSGVVPDESLYERKADLSARMDGWNLAVTLLSVFPPNSTYAD